MNAMKYFSKLKRMSILEIIVIAIFIVYVIFPIGTPIFLAPYVESAIGMIVLFCIVVFLFIYSNPILAVLFVFVAYELLRRSTKTTTSTPKATNYISYAQPPENARDTVVAASERQTLLVDQINANTSLVEDRITLEEAVISQMAPIGKTEPTSYITSTFKPVATNVQGASPI
jgi:hypothetical protein